MKAQSSVELMMVVAILSFIFLIIGVMYINYQKNAIMLKDKLNCEKSVREVATVVNKVSFIPNSSYKLTLNSERCIFGVYDRYVYGLYTQTEEGYAHRLSEALLTNHTTECQYNASGNFIVKNNNGVISIEKES